MERKIDPTVDCVFKAILGSEYHPDLLIHFLNSMLDLKGPSSVVQVEMINPFNEKNRHEAKLTAVDIKARDGRGREFQIEIQTSNHPGLAERILFTWACMYSASIEKGQFFTKTRPVISIWLLTENLFPENDLVHIQFEIYSPGAKFYLTRHCEIHVFQLKNWPLDAKILDNKSRWIAFFRNGKNLDPANPPQWMETAEMRKAMSIMKGFSEKDQNYYLYLSLLDQQLLARTWEVSLEEAEAKLGLTQAELRENMARLSESMAELAKQESKLAEQGSKLAEQDSKLAEQDSKLAEQDSKLAEQGSKLAEQDSKLAKQDFHLAEQDSKLTQSQSEIERLMAMLGKAGIDPNQE